MIANQNGVPPAGRVADPPRALIDGLFNPNIRYCAPISPFWIEDKKSYFGRYLPTEITNSCSWWKREVWVAKKIRKQSKSSPSDKRKCSDGISNHTDILKWHYGKWCSKYNNLRMVLSCRLIRRGRRQTSWPSMNTHHHHSFLHS